MAKAFQVLSGEGVRDDLAGFGEDLVEVGLVLQGFGSCSRTRFDSIKLRQPDEFRGRCSSNCEAHLRYRSTERGEVRLKTRWSRPVPFELRLVGFRRNSRIDTRAMLGHRHDRVPYEWHEQPKWD